MNQRPLKAMMTPNNDIQIIDPGGITYVTREQYEMSRYGGFFPSDFARLVASSAPKPPPRGCEVCSSWGETEGHVAGAWLWLCLPCNVAVTEPRIVRLSWWKRFWYSLGFW